MQDLENQEFKRLCVSASSLAATALAQSTSEAYGRAWGHFMDYCSQMGFDPLEASGPVVATWVAQRAEETSLPNVLEQDLKSVKCFRLAAKQPFNNVYMADTTLVGCKKKMEAKPRLRLGLEPEVVQILYKNALSDEVIGCFV